MADQRRKKNVLDVKGKRGVPLGHAASCYEFSRQEHGKNIPTGANDVVLGFCIHNVSHLGYFATLTMSFN